RLGSVNVRGRFDRQERAWEGGDLRGTDMDAGTLGRVNVQGEITDGSDVVAQGGSFLARDANTTARLGGRRFDDEQDFTGGARARIAG
ncbi:MAG: hypothetical protein ACOC2T_01655, partial [Planctomycetota bacterium]